MPSYPLADLKARIGETKTTVEDLVVEAGKVEEFATAIHDPNPLYRDPESAQVAGLDPIPAPPTFLRTWYFPRYRPDGVGIDFGFDLGLDPRHTIHGQQRYEYHRPVFVGDTLSGETTLADVYQRTGSRGGTMTFAVFETTFTADDGTCVARVENTRIETEGAITGDPNTDDRDSEGRDD
ncbi:MaoC family dehydratase N-terminal domain-containing protein [Halomarina halobia]|uniref:MaoC family dehydratase N-terminal domain-containing protein n=1 Tax=Halomarina halobia TaxID=3033386 RepID=A0ABD6AF46_9EURY|nr:MaoC family dehydratase N-terminal domain-containing protein [Halomarina sp. PSR21]